MQYVYKQGGQTVLIDYPMSEDAYSKLKPTANSASSTGNTVVVKQSAVSQPKILLSTSVDTLANSLISQITTPVNVATPVNVVGATVNTVAAATNVNGNPEPVSDSKSSSLANNGALPKFQFAFGQRATTTSGGAQPQAIETAGGKQTTTTSVEVVNGTSGGSVTAAAATGQTRQLHVISGSPAANNQGVTHFDIFFHCVHIRTFRKTIIRQYLSSCSLVLIGTFYFSLQLYCLHL